MKAKTYKAAGYVAVLAVAAFILEVIASFVSQVPAYSEWVPPNLQPLMLVLHVAFASYATLCLRSFLNDRYGFHATDTLIPLLVGGGIALGLALIGSPYLLGDEAAVMLMLGVGVPLGVISMLFGYKLLSVDSDIAGLKKPFAYSHILAPICFMTVVLAPLGLLLLLLAGVLLAMMFFSEEEQEVEFV